MQINKPRAPLLLIDNCGRAGTTLLARILQLPNCVSFSEPDTFTGLANIIQESQLYSFYLFCNDTNVLTGALGNDIAPYVSILRSIITVTCKNQKNGVMYAIKTRCFSNAILPLLPLCNMPRMAQIYLYREDTNAGARSMVRSFSTRINAYSSYAWKSVSLLCTWTLDGFLLQVGLPLLDRLWMTGACLEKAALRAVKPQNFWEYGIVCFAVQYTYLLKTSINDERCAVDALSKALNCYFSVFKLSYENLLKNTKSTVLKIFNHVEKCTGYELNIDKQALELQVPLLCQDYYKQRVITSDCHQPARRLAGVLAALSRTTAQARRRTAADYRGARARNCIHFAPSTGLPHAWI